MRIKFNRNKVCYTSTVEAIHYSFSW